MMYKHDGVVLTTNPEPEPNACPLGSCFGFMFALSILLRFEVGCFNTLVMYTTDGLQTLWMLTTVFSSGVRPRLSSSSAEGMEIRDASFREVDMDEALFL